MNRDWSGIIAVISLIATVLSASAGLFQLVNPKYATIALLVSGVLSAVTKRVQRLRRPRKPPQSLLGK